VLPRRHPRTASTPHSRPVAHRRHDVGGLGRDLTSMPPTISVPHAGKLLGLGRGGFCDACWHEPDGTPSCRCPRSPSGRLHPSGDPRFALEELECAEITVPVGASGCGDQMRALTARAMISTTMLSDTADWSIIVNLAHRDSGRTSVGLNAVALVNDRYR
jgi:hypothetical protein